MRGVYFGDYHTVADWGLILSAKKINPPTPKIINVDIDGRDGTLDLSRALTDDIKFNDREASFSFLVTEGTQSDREYMIQNIINSIHGKRLKIIEPDFLDLYLIGECSVSNVFNDRAYGSFDVSAECEPFRYYIEEVNRVITASASKVDIVLTNTGRKTVTPTVTVEGSVNLEFGESSVSLATGTYKLSNLLLKSGSTIVTVSGSGTVVFTYREGVL